MAAGGGGSAGSSGTRETATASRGDPQPGSAADRGGAAGRGGEAQRGGAPDGSSPVTHFDMKNVDFVIADGIVLHLERLQGELHSRKPGSPPVFDDKETLLLKIDEGVASMTPDGLSNLMNNYVFNYPDAPLKEIEASIDGGLLRLHATMDKGIDVPVEMVGTLEPTPDGNLRYHPTTLEAAGVKAKGLMEVLDLEIAELINVNEARGVRIDENDLLMFPSSALPPPRVEGEVVELRIEPDRVVMVFGGGKPVRLDPDAPGARNYMFFQGGKLRMGKLLMNDADMQIVDADPKDPFMFSIDAYLKQLVAGTPKITPDNGLVVSMPDLDDVGRGAKR